jgi:hypothetical protein
LDTYKGADGYGEYTAGGECSRIDAPVYVCGHFPWLSDVHGVGMASRAVFGLVEVYFVLRVLIKELEMGG